MCINMIYIYMCINNIATKLVLLIVIAIHGLNVHGFMIIINKSVYGTVDMVKDSL